MRVVVSDDRTATAPAEATAAYQYYAFGSPMPGRYGLANLVGRGYRYGFNGQEKDDDISGSGNHNTALYWEYDTRTGRRWNLDPKPMKGVSEYACFVNGPVKYNDPKGDTPAHLIAGVGGFFLDVGVQLVVLKATEKTSWYEALENVDFYDAAVTGVVSAATLGAGTEMSLARSTASAVVRRLATVTTGTAVVKASSDYTVKNGATSLMDNSKSGVDAVLDFGFDIIGAKSASGLLDGSKRSIVNCVEQINHANTMVPVEREVYKKVMKVVKNEKTKKAVETLAGFTSSGINQSLKGSKKQKESETFSFYKSK